MEFFYVVKATQKSGKQDAVIWFTAKSEARAALTLDVELEEAGIETGRGKDYAKPVRTDYPIFNDLPEESTIDLTWCDRYELADDQRTWNLKAQADDAQGDDTDDEGTAGDEGYVSHIVDSAYTIAPMPFRTQLLAQFNAEDIHVYHINKETQAKLSALEMDTDNAYVQNLLLAAGNVPDLKKYDMNGLWKLTKAIKEVFPQDRRPELGLLIQFMNAWMVTGHVDRGILTSEWAAGNRISGVGIPIDQKSEEPQPSEPYKRAVAQNMANLSIEIAIALLYPDAQPGKIIRPQLVAAKELADKKDPAHVKALKVLGKTTDILDYDANSIFGVTRAISWTGEETSSELRGLVREWFTANGFYENGDRSKGYPEWDEDSRNAPQEKEVHPASTSQPQVASLGGGVFSIEGLMNEKQPQTDDRSSVNEETTGNVQMETTNPQEGEVVDAIPPGEGSDAAAAQTVTLNPADVLAAAAPELAKATAPEDTIEAPEETASALEGELMPQEPAPEYPAYFEPGRYEGLPNNVYHAANGISSTQVKDARVSLMYFNARHVAKTIPREGSKVLDMGNLVHGLALQPENLDEEFSVEPVIPEGAFTTAATIRAFIDEHNASLPALLSADDIKVLLEQHNATLPAPLSADDIKALLDEHNATLPAQVSLGAALDETAQSYMALPAEYQRIEADQKQTAAAMKACIKEYNATLPTPLKTSGSRDALLEQLAIVNPDLVAQEANKAAPVKTSGSRDALLEQLAIINPDLVAQEAQKPAPLKVSGTKADLIQAVKSVNPNAVFADELLDAWRENPDDKILVTHQQMETALAIQKALHSHPTAGKLLLHPDRAVETSYFGIDEETGLEIRVRPDLEIDIEAVRIGADLKTISMWNVKQTGLRARLHREIIDRDYHLSAAMYMNTAALDQFFWIFVNKDEGYHWIAIVEASEELIELGMLEYRQTMNRIGNAFDTGEWPAPITDDYTDELNDYDLRRLEVLRTQA
ncbi:PD-(D/E)XK nuclease-like domain-containing protein [Enterobacteriaceae bacterium H4N4]|uniref:PD-(D/E)XK nuclease-like domain-containing protein n=1 Tax=Silvania confinis TaxID=2926470 RepID=A0A9J6QNZ3_9ENTR|nr:RecE family exodeoxyribonuclease [Silvania confinis]MCU6669957.1 PD-(D/E)XK nuclease-like domain-containing protein [Silvania confinis]